MSQDMPITPETRIGALLAAYPELEDVLIDVAPAFEKLKNPVLRRTVARLATLKQAARMGGVSARALVLRLRRAVGQAATGLAPDEEQREEPTPAWVTALVRCETVDADSLLDSGESPLGVVLELVRPLGPGEGLRIRSTFRPEPLLDALSKKGLSVHCRAAAPERYETFLKSREREVDHEPVAHSRPRARPDPTVP